MFLEPLRNGGPAAATSLAGFLNFALLLGIFVRRHGELGHRAILLSAGKVSAATACHGAGLLEHAAGLRLPAATSLERAGGP